jgi:VIT1/CCC1 family predicted Fe2+/Mn2+ transporter
MIPIFAALSLLIAGYFYIFSAGDSEKANKAKAIIKWNIIAILVAFLSYGIVKIIASFFGQI